MRSTWAPPTLSRLHKVTGDEKYLRFLDQEYRYSYDHLYDPEEHLFYRDANYFEKKTPAGTKTFWSRGNGWVYGGLPLLLESLPADHTTRGFYENLFKEMTGAVVAAQQPDGLWHPSMLDPNEIPLGETSGSGFFIYGLAWGVNNGLLDRATYWPVITRGWTGLMTRIKPDGYVGYVQPVGSAPAPLGPESVQDYGTGAFLLAGSELLRALGGASHRETRRPARRSGKTPRRRSEDPPCLRSPRAGTHGRRRVGKRQGRLPRLWPAAAWTSRRTAASTPGAKRFPIR
jgi:unsaturated rhamnogalacturonyl hydrolase